MDPQTTPRTDLARACEQDAHVFASALERIMPLAPSSVERALPLFRARELERGQYLLRGGDLAYETGVVVRGLLREHFLMPGGVERTKAFVMAGGITGSLADLISGQRSRAFIVADEPTRMLVAPFAAIRALGAVDPGWRDFNERMMQVLYLQKAEREFELLGLDAEQRYAAFTARFPGLEARVAARHVASYLGITPVHLSRLRKRRRSGQRTGSA